MVGVTGFEPHAANVDAAVNKDSHHAAGRLTAQPRW